MLPETLNIHLQQTCKRDAVGHLCHTPVPNTEITIGTSVTLGDVSLPKVNESTAT